MDRFELSYFEDTRFFSSYKSAFNFYMKIRDYTKWLSLYDHKTGKMLIFEDNTFIK